MALCSTLFTTDEELDRAKRLLKAYEGGDYSIPEEELWKAKKSTSSMRSPPPVSEETRVAAPRDTLAHAPPTCAICMMRLA